jgi:hypothetical protein
VVESSRTVPATRPQRLEMGPLSVRTSQIPISRRNIGWEHLFFERDSKHT